MDHWTRPDRGRLATLAATINGPGRDDEGEDDEEGYYVQWLAYNEGVGFIKSSFLLVPPSCVSHNVLCLFTCCNYFVCNTAL